MGKFNPDNVGVLVLPDKEFRLSCSWLDQATIESLSLKWLHVAMQFGLYLHHITMVFGV